MFQEAINVEKDVLEEVKGQREQMAALMVTVSKGFNLDSGLATEDMTERRNKLKTRIQEEVWHIDVINEATITLLGNPAYQQFAAEKILPKLPIKGQRNEIAEFHTVIIMRQYSKRLFAYMYPTQHM